MSLQYIIDAYNLINNPLFANLGKRAKDAPLALLEFIRTKRPAVSLKNKVILVFDGYPNSSYELKSEGNIEIIFARDITADERIKKIVEASSNPKNIVVISDDREIKFYVKSIGAKVISVEDFIGPRPIQPQDLLKPELSHIQISKINQELKKLWLR